MEENYTTDDFLAKWASGELSEAEKEAFKKTDDYIYYQAILEGTDILEVPEYDKEKLFEKVQKSKLDEPKVVTLFPKWIYGVAASVAILMGFFLFMNKDIVYETSYGETLAVTLPDNSEVILNANSKLSFKEKGWGKTQRTISLSGEAFFKVTKGTEFSVGTENGKVTVLGTQFTVNAHASIFEVICFEGKVRAESQNQDEIVTKGEAVRLINNAFETFNINGNSPSWLQDESSFDNAPLVMVIKALENQYNLQINSQNIDESQRFTGSFTHSYQETALRTVFESMNITFIFKNENTIDLSKR